MRCRSRRQGKTELFYSQLGAAERDYETLKIYPWIRHTLSSLGFGFEETKNCDRYEDAFEIVTNAVCRTLDPQKIRADVNSRFSGVCERNYNPDYLLFFNSGRQDFFKQYNNQGKIDAMISAHYDERLPIPQNGR